MKSAILSFISMFLLPIILLRGVSAPIEDAPKNDALVTEGEVTVTSLEELKRYTDAGLFSENQYDFYYVMTGSTKNSTQSSFLSLR